MKVKYDKENDVLYIWLNNNHVSESDNDKQRAILDYDQSNSSACIEVLNVSSKMKNSLKAEFEMM